MVSPQRALAPAAFAASSDGAPARQSSGTTTVGETVWIDRAAADAGNVFAHADATNAA
ncbi:hypothetical protein [Microbacterium marmarense]|uniref:Uncharacterized protein n=1 Tax=Microbacterium marmarense TaxID=3122051 RepID=A0ABU8LUR4_9MICO